MAIANPSTNWVYYKVVKPYQHYKKTNEIPEELPVFEKDEDDEDNIYQDGQVLVDVFSASTYDNKDNLPRDFIKTMESAYKGQFKKRFVDGEWGALEGLVYPSFNAEKHMVTHGSIMKYLMKCLQSGVKIQGLEGFDFGLAAPSCYLIGFLTPEGIPVIVDGYYRPSNDPIDDGMEISRLRQKYYPYIDLSSPILADPAIFKRTIFKRSGKGATTIAKILSVDFDLSVKRAQNDIINGIAKVSSYLNATEIPNPITGNNSDVAILFSSHLHFIADEFGGYFWKMGHQNERIDEPIDTNDHAMDTLKYMLSYLPPAYELLFKKRFVI
jgi:hypothetical protein